MSVLPEKIRYFRSWGLQTTPTSSLRSWRDSGVGERAAIFPREARDSSPILSRLAHSCSRNSLPKQKHSRAKSRQLRRLPNLPPPATCHAPMAVTLTWFYFQAAPPSLPKVNTTERLKELRQKMQQEGVQAYIIPSVDQHMVNDFKTFYQLMIDMAMKCWQRFLKRAISL